MRILEFVWNVTRNVFFVHVEFEELHRRLDRVEARLDELDDFERLIRRHTKKPADIVRLC